MAVDDRERRQLVLEPGAKQPQGPPSTNEEAARRWNHGARPPWCHKSNFLKIHTTSEIGCAGGSTMYAIRASLSSLNTCICSLNNGPTTCRKIFSCPHV